MIRIDSNLKQCFVNDNPIKLTKSEYLLLEYLWNNPNKIFSRKELAEKANITGLRTVDAVISRLRKKIGCHYIKTRLGFGYGLILD